MNITVEPTRTYARGPVQRRTIEIGVIVNDSLGGEYMPYSHARTMNVGVGGRHCSIAPGEKVRRATLAELRIIDRRAVLRALATHPSGKLIVRRARF